MIKISNSKELIHNVRVLSQLVAQTSMPILSFIKVEVTNGKMRLTATNLETTVIITVQCNSDEKKTFLVPSREFARILPFMEDKIEIEAGENVLIKDNKTNFVLRSLDVNEYPEEPKMDVKNTIEIPSKILYTLITSVIFNAAKDNLRPMLNGINIDLKEGNINMIATDGRRLGINSRKITNNNITQNFTIPSGTLSLLLRLINTEEENISVSYNDTFCFFRQKHIIIIATKLHGEYPNVSSIISTLGDKYIKINKKSVIESLNKLSIFADEVNNLVKWQVINNTIKMQAINDYGKGYLSLDVENPYAQSYKVGFNYLYMLEILKVISNDTINFYYKDETAPLAVKTEENPAVYIFMPIKIAGDNNEENKNE